MASLFKKVGSFFLDIIEVVVTALAFFVVVYLFLFQPHQVKGNSMYPNFYDKEYLLTDKVSYRFGEPERGDVIIFKAPRNEEYEYIKRIIGLPNEKVMISEGHVFVNNQQLNEAYLPPSYQTRAGTFASENQIISLGGSEYFVLGDNRSHSSDSRDWGPVPEENIIGKTWLRYWPINRIGTIKEPAY